MLKISGIPMLPTQNKPISVGNIFYVNNGASNDSNSPSPAAGTLETPFSTIDYAVGQCTANNGDVILVGAGHTEAVSAIAGLDLDVAGITIIFLGHGNNRGTINFTTVVGADMDVDAADITMINPRFTAGIDALTGPIDVNAARFKLIGMDGERPTWQDGTSINTTDCVVADANADDIVIDGLEFIDGDAGGTQKQSFVQVAGATRPTIRNIRCTGDFGTGIIENGTAWVDATLENLVLDNASVSPTVCLLLQATSTGWVRNSSLRVASLSTGYTATNDMQFDNVKVTGTDAAYASDPILGGIADAAATGAVTTTDTMMAYIKQLVTELQVVDEFHDVPAANNVLNAQINEVIGNKTDAAATGVVTATDTLVGYQKQVVTNTLNVSEAGVTTAPTANTLADTLHKDGNFTYDNTTDSLEAIRDRVDTLNTADQVDLDAILADTDTISGIALPANPTANSLAAFIASGGTALGTELADSKSIVDAIGHTGSAFHTSGLGYWDPKTITVAADEVTQDLFAVTGGPIQILSLVGYVDVLIGATPTSAKIILDATAGAGYDLEFSTSVAITDDAVGTIYVFSDANPAVLTPLTPGAASGGTQLMKGGFFCPPGMIEQTMTADPGGAVGDHITWYMTYRPLVTGVTVTAQ